MTAPFTLIDDGTPRSLEASVQGERVRIPAAQVEAALGWRLEPEGLCRGGVCVPVRERGSLLNDEGIDLAELARLLDRPLALDGAERAGALGAAASERASQLATLEAPDFTLPDFSGKQHSLTEHRGKKVLLVAYASW